MRGNTPGQAEYLRLLVKSTQSLDKKALTAPLLFRPSKSLMAELGVIVKKKYLKDYMFLL